MNTGISSFDKQKTTQEQYEVLGNSILQEQSQQLTTQLQVFQNLLLTYSHDHSKEITENPKFRSEFSKICQSFGLDPLVNTTTDEKNDEFYYQLCIRIIEICHNTKDINGGIILINELIKILNNKQIETQDIITLIDKLQILGDEIKIIKIGSKQYLKTIPQDLNQDQHTVLDTCELVGGYVTVSLLRDNFQWDKIRCRTVIDDMVSNGLLWIDQVDNELNYWVPNWVNE